MSEIVNDPLLLSCYYLFPNFGSRNFNDLVLISSRLAREASAASPGKLGNPRAFPTADRFENPEGAELIDEALDTLSPSTTTRRSR